MTADDKPYTPSTGEVRKPGIYVLDYDPSDSPMEHDVLRLTASGDWFKVGHGLPITFYPNDDDTFERLIPERELESVRAEARAEAEARAQNAEREERRLREAHQSEFARAEKAEAERDALAVKLRETEIDRDEWRDQFRDRKEDIDGRNALIEKVREAVEELSADAVEYPVEAHHRARLLHILDAAPSEVLAERDARKWDEGYAAGYRQGYGGEGGGRNPYRAVSVSPVPQTRDDNAHETEEGKRMLMTHPHDGHGPNDTCFDCETEEGEQ